ncbi:MAG TPA: hypothetical protein DCR55_01680 [Lentisphaeria bacterium]|nr:hypothetical protein [Lentisphaeria bacterium]
MFAQSGLNAESATTAELQRFLILDKAKIEREGQRLRAPNWGGPVAIETTTWVNTRSPATVITENPCPGVAVPRIAGGASGHCAADSKSRGDQGDQGDQGNAVFHAVGFSATAL